MSGRAQPRAERRGRSRARRLLDHPLAHLLAAILVIALVQGFAVKLFAVPSGSMEHTLETGDRILVNRLAAAPRTGDVVVFTADDELWPESGTDGGSGSDAESGAWGTVKHAAKWVLGDLLGIGPTTSRTLVKRVIGTAGQTVACCDVEGRVLVDGAPLEEPYVFEDPPFEARTLDCESDSRSARCFAEVTVPDGMLLVLGDHRGASSDSILPCRGSPDAGAACVRWVREDDVVGEVFAVAWPLTRIGGVS